MILIIFAYKKSGQNASENDKHSSTYNIFNVLTTCMSLP